MSSMKSCLKDAGAVLARREKITKAIAREVGKLGQAVERLAEAEAKARDAAGLELLGESQSQGRDVEKELRACRTEVELLSESVAALRSQAKKMAPAVLEQYRRLEGELPDHNAAIVESFKREWEKAVAGWSSALARRAVVEVLIGHKLRELPEPSAAGVSVSVGELEAPKKSMSDLRSLLEVLAANAPTRTPQFASVLKPFYPDRIYVLQRPFSDGLGPLLPVGTLLIEAILGPGWLDHLARVGDAIPLPDPAAANDPEIKRALAQIETAEAESQRARSAEGLRPADAPAASEEIVPVIPSPYMDVYSAPAPSHGGVVHG